MSDDLKRLAAMTALNEMLASSSPNICLIDKIGAMLGIEPKRAGDAYAVLSTLHCVAFAKMPHELRDRIPGLIQECLGVEPTFQFEAPPIPGDELRSKVRNLVATIDAATESAKQKPRGLLRLLGGS